MGTMWMRKSRLLTHALLEGDVVMAEDEEAHAAGRGVEAFDRRLLRYYFSAEGDEVVSRAERAGTRTLRAPAWTQGFRFEGRGLAGRKAFGVHGHACRQIQV